ncbi:class I SAM-dependent methyltransferase [Aporhodopirellula aestuarii]|uniref:Class I SAM-dependent methyltransferase n=1 Tax=Aporhodopirellula aestuarii TaxID=2950107 RepID=A0ABT0UE89_9BACT|nr:class I SAM-dependent methyltransferase [Aporhodopirellula aestuarii]MCM2375136.1 class I SAM-dependent methyltransferase [Aporhodopirellula aestuarii]
MSDTKIKSSTCPGCEASELSPFFQVDSVAANVGTLPQTREQALQAPSGSIDLVICRGCGLIHNRRFDVSQVGFEPGYEVSLFHTKVFREFIQGVCEQLIRRHDLHAKRVLEIGCGGGDFLKLLCELGGNQGIGVDPTVPARHVEAVGDGQVTLIPGYFTDEHAELIGDFVCCLSVFEAVPASLEFLRTLRRCIGDRDVPIYFEVFNGFRSIQQSEVWSIHYEQCNYFGLQSLTGLFQAAGFDVTRSGTCYQGDQYLFVEAVPAEARPIEALAESASDSVQEMVRCTERFQKDYFERAGMWRKRMSQWKADQSDVVVWGSGGKGISFLNAVEGSEIVRSVIDVNPNRQGRFIPLSGHEIVSPETLAAQPADVVIVTNALYQEEIRSQLNQLGMTAELLVA